LLLAVLASAAPQEHFVKLTQASGLRVRYLSEGKGHKAIVLVHGWTCGAMFWRQQSSDFAHAGYRVLSIDLPGHGKSDKPLNVEYSVPLFAQAVEAMMRDAHVNRAVIVGHSMGTPVAVQAVVDHPEKFTGLVDVDGAIWRYSGPRARPYPFAARLRSDYLGVAGSAIDGMFTASTPALLRDEIKERMLSTPVHVAASAMENLSESDVWTHTPVSLPVLAIVAGPQREDDRRSIREAFFPNLRFEKWDEAGHFLMMEQPERFDQLVLDWVQRIESGRVKEADSQ
jgi:pimeloyl-ACP methyl ester carboxylesterase